MLTTPSTQGPWGQIDPTETSDYVLYTLTLSYTVQGVAQTFVSQAISVRVANSTWSYAAGYEYWETDLWSCYTDPKNKLKSLTFAGAASMWQNTPTNPLPGAHVGEGASQVSWVSAASLPAGTWLYAPAVQSTPAAGISLVVSGGNYLVNWGIFATTKPAPGTYVVSVGGRSFNTTPPSGGSAGWYVPA
jgi:hypothetical protein